MSFDTFNTVLFTAIFIVPGFIWSTVLSMLVPRRSQATELRAIEFLTLSCVNHGLWIWLLVPLLSGDFLRARPFTTGIVLILPVLVSPVFLGLVSAHLSQNDRVKHLLARFGFRTIHPSPTAWDYHFSRAHPYWVIVTLRDGSRVYGWFGSNSFAGDAATERDLYLESVFVPMDSGDWAPVEDSGGIIIKAEQIAAAEFRRDTETKYDA